MGTNHNYIQENTTTSVHHLQQLPALISRKLLVYSSLSMGPHTRPHRIFPQLLLCLNCVLIIFFNPPTHRSVSKLLLILKSPFVANPAELLSAENCPL